MTTPGPPPGYASDPQLQLLWSSPPPLTGYPASGNSASPQPPPLSDPFAVALSSLQNAQQVMLEGASTLAGTYNPFEQQVQAVISNPTFWGQWAEPEARMVGNPPNDPAYAPNTPLAQQAQQFAEQINPAMTRALRNVADATATIGVFIAMLNSAGQAYTTADKNSQLPSPGNPS
jgi:hypothetical protein